MSDKPHGPVSERFMRHHYGASGARMTPERIAREARREALEDAAKVCDGLAPLPDVDTPYGPAYTGGLAHAKDAVVRCAAAIRALADAADAGAGG